MGSAPPHFTVIEAHHGYRLITLCIKPNNLIPRLRVERRQLKAKLAKRGQDGLLRTTTIWYPPYH